MSCSEEKPRMAELVRIEMNTITLITSYHTPMPDDLHSNMNYSLANLITDYRLPPWDRSPEGIGQFEEV